METGWMNTTPSGACGTAEAAAPKSEVLISISRLPSDVVPSGKSTTISPAVRRSAISFT